MDLAAPATVDERARFDALQRRFTQSFSAIFNNPVVPRTVLVVPSLSLAKHI